jgi:hypothetical protein
VREKRAQIEEAGGREATAVLYSLDPPINSTLVFKFCPSKLATSC